MNVIRRLSERIDLFFIYYHYNYVFCLDPFVSYFENIMLLYKQPYSDK